MYRAMSRPPPIGNCPLNTRAIGLQWSWELMEMAVRLQEVLPGDLARLDEEEVERRIAAAISRLRERIVILGHHYQRDEIIQFADHTGDSYKLAVTAARLPEKEYIIFCGVHFMAESADILTGPNQKVILPNLEAGCSMADMATYDQVTECWEDIAPIVGESILPVTYVNSSAAIKAFVGEKGGSCCTSSNADRVFRWAYERADKVLFIPDEHLGHNTGWNMGLRGEDFAVWNPFEDLGGLTEERIRRAKLILWKGFCSVHMRFTVEQALRAREMVPGLKIIVHPECRRELVAIAYEVGSTEKIIQTVTASPAGSKWAVGTEINLVNRLANQNPDKIVFCLDTMVCPCSTMYRIDPRYLLWVLDGLLAGEVRNQIKVPPQIAEPARAALDRMILVTG
jgi:quinolinate synthase